MEEQSEDLELGLAVMVSSSEEEYNDNNNNNNNNNNDNNNDNNNQNYEDLEAKFREEHTSKKKITLEHGNVVEQNADIYFGSAGVKVNETMITLIFIFIYSFSLFYFILFFFFKKTKKADFGGNEDDMIIRCENLHKTYLLGLEGVPALRGVSMSVKRGEFICIFGTSGGGKTTLLNLLGTIDKPTKGHLTICGTSNTQHLHFFYIFNNCFVFF